MTDMPQHAPRSTVRIVRRIAVLGAASALVLAIVGPPTVLAANAKPLAQRSPAKITKVHVGHMAKTRTAGRTWPVWRPALGKRKKST